MPSVVGAVVLVVFMLLVSNPCGEARQQHAGPSIVSEAGFDGLDREIIRAIAAHAGLALELAQVRQDNENLRRVEDRAHIAEDLRQRVIQPMFNLGLALQGAASRAAKSDVRDSIQEQVDAVNQIIKDIRAAVFRLNPADD